MDNQCLPRQMMLNRPSVTTDYQRRTSARWSSQIMFRAMSCATHKAQVSATWLQTTKAPSSCPYNSSISLNSGSSKFSGITLRSSICIWIGRCAYVGESSCSRGAIPLRQLFRFQAKLMFWELLLPLAGHLELPSAAHLE